MNKALRHLFLLSLLLQLGGCSFAELTVRASMPMIEGGMLAVNREDDLLLAEAAMPANIELMEGMLINAPDHRELRNYAAQAYYGLAPTGPNGLTITATRRKPLHSYPERHY